ncbi:hypothetical protein, conserved [Angomonas deanei]|uniref:EF-hand domain-containing protein n=1 Tax=Angomonas deanei TaxID=59799 RepID=A0A7G2BZ82_9TRYP|nr:hypothetical protein, conserved [Angomonas deanei]
MQNQNKEVVKDITSASQLENELQISQAQHGVAVLDIYNAEWGNAKALNESFRRLFTDAGDLVHLRFFSVECNLVLNSLKEGKEVKNAPPQRAKSARSYAPDTTAAHWTSILEERCQHSKPYFIFYKEGKHVGTIEGIDTPKICKYIKSLCEQKNPYTDYITNADLLRFWGAHFKEFDSEVSTDALEVALRREGYDLNQESLDALFAAVGMTGDRKVTAASMQTWMGDESTLKEKIATITVSGAAITNEDLLAFWKKHFGEEQEVSFDAFVAALQADGYELDEESIAKLRTYLDVSPDGKVTAVAAQTWVGHNTTIRSRITAITTKRKSHTSTRELDNGIRVSKVGSIEMEPSPVSVDPIDGSMESPATSKVASPDFLYNQESSMKSPQKATEEGDYRELGEQPTTGTDKVELEEKEEESRELGEEEAAEKEEDPYRELGEEEEKPAEEEPEEDNKPEEAPEEEDQYRELGEEEEKAAEEEPEEEEKAAEEEPEDKPEEEAQEEEDKYRELGEEEAADDTPAEEEPEEKKEEAFRELDEEDIKPAKVTVGEIEEEDLNPSPCANDRKKSMNVEMTEEERRASMQQQQQQATVEKARQGESEWRELDEEEGVTVTTKVTRQMEGTETNQIFVNEHWVTVTEREMEVWNKVADLPLHYPENTARNLIPEDELSAVELPNGDDFETLEDFMLGHSVAKVDFDIMCLAADAKIGSESLSLGKLALVLVIGEQDDIERLAPCCETLFHELGSGALLARHPQVAYTAMCLCSSDTYPDEAFNYITNDEETAFLRNANIGEVVVLKALAPLQSEEVAEGLSVRVVGIPKVIELASTDDVEGTVVLSQWYNKLKVIEKDDNEVTLEYVGTLSADAFESFVETYTARLIESDNRLDKKADGERGTPAPAEEDNDADDHEEDENDEL